MHHILVTGGAGFIGSNFIRYILNAIPEVQVFNLDALTYAGSLENLKDLPSPERHHFIQGDIRDYDLIVLSLQKYQIDTVVHFAAESHVDRSILGPSLFVQTNVVGTCTILDALRQVWLNDINENKRDHYRFHHVSTDEVFGSLDGDSPSWTEMTPYAPNSPYAASKAASDHFVRAYGHTYGLPYSVTNCSNNYGPYQFPEKLIPLMIMNALQGRPLPVYGDGKQIRDWLFVEDHCEAIALVLQKGKIGETYNIGGNNQPTNLEIVHTMCKVLDELVPNSPYVPHSDLIQFVKDRPGHDRRYAIAADKIEKEIGWKPAHSFETGIDKTITWYLNNKSWWEKIKSGEYRNYYHQMYGNRSSL
jgi:dTDP-glucose 4,6-dehydratase